MAEMNWTAELITAQREAQQVMTARFPRLPIAVVARRVADTITTMVTLGYWSARGGFTPNEIADFAEIESPYSQSHALWQGSRQ